MRRLLIAGVLILILLVAGAEVLGQPDTAVATLMVAEGQVTLTQNQARWGIFPMETTATLTPGSFVTVHQGDVIQQDSGLSQLRLQDGSTIDLMAGTILRIDELHISPSDYRVQLQLIAGNTVNRVVKLLGPADYFRISTPSSTAAVRGTVFSVGVLSATSTQVRVDEGIVRVTMSADFVDVLAGQMVTAVVGQPLQVLPQTGAPTINNNAPTDNDTAPGNPANPTATVMTSSTTTNAILLPTRNQTTAVPTTPGILATSTLATPTNAAPTNAAPTSAVPTNPPVGTTMPTVPGATSLPPTPTTAAALPTATLPATNTPWPTAVPTATQPVPPTATQPPPATAVPTLPPPTATPEPPTPEPATPTPELVTLCHIPSGNPNNAQTIEVAPDAVAAHLAHGDYLGPCQ